MKLETLFAFRERGSSYNITTTIKDKEGKVKAVFPSSINQPKKGSKTIVLNCWTYALDWSNVKEKTYYVKVKDRPLSKKISNLRE